MSNISTVQLSEVPAYTIGAVPLDAGQLTAPGRALAGVGQDIQQVGGILGHVAMQVQDHVNQGILAGQQNARMQLSSQIQTYMTKNQATPEKWQDYIDQSWKAYNDSVTKQANEEKWGPNVVRQNTLESDQYQEQTGVQFQAATLGAKVRKANAHFEAQANLLMTSGDMAGAKAQIAKMDLYAEQILPVTQRVTENAVKTAIVKDPIGTLDKLKDSSYLKGDLNADQRLSLVTEAGFQAHRKQSDNLNDVRTDFDNGKLISDDDLKAMVDTNQITPRGAASFKTYVKGTENAQAKDKYLLINGDILNTDPTTIKDPQQWGRDVKDDAAALPTQYRNMIIRQVDSKLASADRLNAKQENPVHTETYARMKSDFATGLTLPGHVEQVDSGRTTPGRLWGTNPVMEDKVVAATADDRTKWQAPNSTLSADTQNAAKLHYAQQLEKMQTWFEQNPKATYTQAEEFRQSITQPYLMEAVKRSLTPQSTTAEPVKSNGFIVGKTYKDAKGNSAIWNGTSWEESK